MYIDLLTKIRNSQAVGKESIKTYYTKMDEAVLGVLVKRGYVEGFEVKGRQPKKILEVKLKYEEEKGVINGVKFFSKPGQKIQFGYKKILPVKNGYGVLVLSTPKGVMSGEDARKNKIGGEALFKIW